MPIQDFLKNNADTLLQTGIGLIGGRTAAEQASMGLQGFQQGRKQNRTMQYLQTANPELAQAVQSGALDPADAFKLHFQQQMEQKKLDQALKTHQYTAVGKNIFDNTTAQFIQAPGSSADDLFDGSSVEGQALNGMVKSGRLTKDQALEWAASKGITGPNGEALMASPLSLASPAPAAPVAPQSAPDVAPIAQPQPGITQLTKPKDTQDNLQSSTFVNKMIAADQVLSDPDVLKAGQAKVANTLNDWLPFHTGDYLTDENFKKYDQAKREFVNSVLRKESGASISPTEFASAERQYFPQPGEGPDIVAQKAAARKRAIDGMAKEAGPNYSKPAISPSTKGTEVIVNGKRAVVTKMSD